MNADSRPAVFVSSPNTLAQKLLSALEQHGFHGLHYPAFEIEWLAASTPPTTPSLIIVTSPNAVAGAKQASLSLPPSAQFIATGKGTAKSLKTLGISNAIYPDQAGSEGLLKLPKLQQYQGQPTWLLTGEGGRGLLEVELPKLGIHFDRIATYARHANNNAQQLRNCIQTTPPAISLATSVEALDNLARISDAATSTRLGSSHWIVSSDRIAQRLQQHWPKAQFTQSKGPDGDALLAACIAWKEEQ